MTTSRSANTSENASLLGILCARSYLADTVSARYLVSALLIDVFHDIVRKRTNSPEAVPS